MPGNDDEGICQTCGCPYYDVVEEVPNLINCVNCGIVRKRTRKDGKGTIIT